MSVKNACSVPLKIQTIIPKGCRKYWTLFLALAAVLLLAAGDVDARSGGQQIAGQTRAYAATVTIPTHIVDGFLIYHVNPDYNMPYNRLNWADYNDEHIENRTYNLIILENDYLKLSFLPQLGGRLYQAIFKPTGNNIFYQNPVLKPAPWGPTDMGWWMAIGGMEWGLPVEEHGYEWGIPWDYRLIDLPDGMRFETWDTTAGNRLRAKVAVTLPDDAAYFTVTPTLENPTSQTIDYKFWLNAMLAPGPANQASPNLRVVMPTDRVTVHSTNDSRLPDAGLQAGWPVHNGVDWSLLGNWQEWYGFFQYPRAGGDFQAVYDEGYDEGVVRAYDSTIAQGAKFFAFGSGSDAIPSHVYTSDDSSYVEIHGGVAPTFAGTHRLAPGKSVSWSEHWYPVAGLGSLTWANEHVSLYLEDVADNTQLHVSTNQPVSNARVLLLRRSTNQILYQIDGLAIGPEQPFHSPIIHLPNLTGEAMSVLVYNGDTLLGAYQYDGGPVETPVPVPTPTAVPTWQGGLVNLISFDSWASVIRVRVRNKTGLKVTLKPEQGDWQAVGYTGQNPDNGTDGVEFSPLTAGTYIITPEGLGTSFRLELEAGKIAEVLFQESTLPFPTPVPTSILTATPLPTFTPTPTPSPAPTSTPTPVPPTATPTSALIWTGRIDRIVSMNSWMSVVRVRVTDHLPTSVIISSLFWNWSNTNQTGTKPEYGLDVAEFAPVAPGRYIIKVPEVDAEIELNVLAGTITEIVFGQTTPSEATATPVPSATSLPTPTPTASSTATPLPTSIATETVTPSPTPSSTPTPTEVPPTPTFTPSATQTPTSTATRGPVRPTIISPITTPTFTPSSTPTATDIPPTATFTPGATVTTTSTATQTPTPSGTPTPTDVPATATSTPSATATSTSTLSPTPTATLTPTVTPSSTATATTTATATATATATFTPTSSSTPLPTATFTPTSTPRPTSTATPTPRVIAITPISPIKPTPTVTASPTPRPTVTPTLQSTPTPRWRVRIDSNEKVSTNWFGVIRTSLEGEAGRPVRITVITSEARPWSTTCTTGSKPEYGPYFCEFSPLIPGRYRISPVGLDISIDVLVGRGAVAVVIFEQY